MSTDGAAKPRKSAAKVGGEFGAVGGIVIVGGVLAVGIAAGAIACLRRRPRKMVDKPREKPGENSSVQGKLEVPMSENVEEVEPILEIATMEKLSVESFSPMDLKLFANEKSINRSKGDESPRSHFSLSTSSGTSASVSSDSEDLVEINQMSFKENGFVPQEETSGKASFDFTVGRESECISGKELVELNVEYEESVDSFDGLEDGETVGGQKVNDCKESEKSNLVFKERFDAEECVELVGGDREDDKVSIKDDGSIHDEMFHVPIDGIDAANVSCEERIVGIDVLKVSEFVEGDLCLDREEKDQIGADAKEETVLFNKEDLQEKVGGSEGLNCDKEECWQAVIGRGEGLTSIKEDCSEDVPRREEDSNVDFGHCDERREQGEVDVSEEYFGPIQQQSRQKIVGSNQEVLFCREECLQEIFECNERRCGEENTDSEESENLELNVKQCLQEKTDTEEDLKGCHVDIAHKSEQCQHGTVDFLGLYSKGGSNNYVEVVQHDELEDSEENLIPINEQAQQETLERKELDCKEVEVRGHQDVPKSDKSESDGANKEEKSVLNVKQCSQEKTDCIAAVGKKGEQCQIGKADSRNFGGLDEDASHENGSCQYGAFGTRELDDLNRDFHSEKRQIENERVDSKEDIQNENFENGSLKSVEDTKNEQFENGGLTSKGFVELGIGLEDKLSPEEENIKEPQEALKVSIMEIECEENAVHSNEKCIDRDAQNFREKPQQEAMDSNESQNFVEDMFVNHEPCKGTICESEESEFVEENMPITQEEYNSSEFVEETMPIAQEEYKQETAISVDIQNSVECIPVTTLQCHIEINESDELGGVAIREPQEALEVSVMKMECEESAFHPKENGVDGDAHIVKEKPQEETVDSNESQNFVEDIFVNHEPCKGTCESEELEFVEENMPIAQEEYKQETVISVDIQNSVECIPVTTLQCHREINESDELGGAAIKEPHEALEVSVMEMKCEESAFHPREKAIDGDAHIVKEKTQEETVDSNESQNFVEDIFVNHELCKGTICESKESEFVEEKVPIAQEEFKEAIVNSVEIHDSVECIPVTTLQCHREINESDELDGVAIEEPQEALEVSVMEMECEENAVHPKETDVDGDEHIFKEKPQEETMDSNESPNFVEDIFVNHELCKGTACESEESEFVEESMPIAQEEYKEEIVNSVDIHDSVEFIPVTTLQCHREINESDELEAVVIPREKNEGDAVYLEQLELSGNLHSHNELCEQEEMLGEQSPPSLKVIVAVEETNDLEFQNQYKQSQEKEIDAKDLGYSSSIVLKLSPNDPDCTEAYESSHEDPQTYNRPEVIGTKDSEYSYGHTIETEKFQVEKVDQVANNYYREDQEICPEEEEVNDENSRSHTHHLNDQYEANQDIEEFKLDDESTDSKSVAPLASEPRKASNTSPVTEREEKGWNPLHSSQLVSNSEEGKSLWMKPRRSLYMRTRIFVSLFATLLAFFFAYRFASIPEIVYAT